MNTAQLSYIAKYIRYLILASTTHAGSGHPTSSLSAVELMTTLFFGGIFRADIKNPHYHNNDRLIFSKGHASPLLYALYGAAGVIKERDLIETLRTFKSPYQGHPLSDFPYAEAATGSLGQGLSIGVGMALDAKYLKKLPYKTYVLLGDGEMAEGSVWEAIQSASYYKLDNFVAILDMNRLGQRGETILGHDGAAYQKRFESFGWKVLCIDGHSFSEILSAYQDAQRVKGTPCVIIAKTFKGRGVSFCENEDNWHGRALSGKEYVDALKEIDWQGKSAHGVIKKPQKIRYKPIQVKGIPTVSYHIGSLVAPRKACAQGLTRVYPHYPDIVILDGEVSNSTYTELFERKYPRRFFQMFIAEQHMAGAAIGLSKRGNIPCVTTFAAFLTRAHDHIRMAQYSGAHITYIGTHAGVSIGQDGPSQMGLEDIAMFRAIFGSVVLYPADAVSAEKLTEAALKHKGITYIRATRMELPVIYKNSEKFLIGTCKVVRQSEHDHVTIIAAGVTLHTALAAYDELQKSGVAVRVIDLYSIKPLDTETLRRAAQETKALIVVEDHVVEGGIGEAVCGALSGLPVRICALAVKKIPCSGTAQELFEYEDISKDAIVRAVKGCLQT
jgi:transketolase